MTTEPTDPSGPPLQPGELRYLVTASTGMQIVEVRERGAIVRRIPGGALLVYRGLSELRRSPRMAPDGFRMGWLQGTLDLGQADGQTLLEAIFADERARGGDRIRVKVLDEYLAPIPDPAKLRDRLSSALTRDHHWRWVGAGIEGGYAPAVGNPTWHLRWEQASIPLLDSPASEQQAEARLTDRLRHLTPGVLGRVPGARWLPSAIRQAACDELAARWRRQPNHAEFRSVPAEAMEGVWEVLATETSPTTLLHATVDPVLSLSARQLASRHLVERYKSITRGDILRLAALAPNARVCSHWFRLWVKDDTGIDALAIFLRAEAPTDDEEGVAVIKMVRDTLADLGMDTLPVLHAACVRACTSGGDTNNISNWLRRIAPDGDRGLVQDAIAGVATLGRLRDRQSDSFTRMGLGRRQVQAGLARWLAEEAAGQEAQPPRPDWGTTRVDGDWANRARTTAAHLRASLQYDDLADAVAALVAARVADSAQIGALSATVESVENARRVLGEAAAEATRIDRAELLRSARAEREEEQAAERVKIARMVSETITAVERVNESTPAGPFAALMERVRELAGDLGLVPLGSVGQRVLIDPANQETRGREGEEGEIRRVGIADSTGAVLVRSGVTTLRRS